MLGIGEMDRCKFRFKRISGLDLLMMGGDVQEREELGMCSGFLA